LIFAELIDVDQRVSRLQRGRLPPESLLKDHIFNLNAHIDIAEAPPHIRLAIIDEAVVVAALCGSIVDQNGV